MTSDRLFAALKQIPRVGLIGVAVLCLWGIQPSTTDAYGVQSELSSMIPIRKPTIPTGILAAFQPNHVDQAPCMAGSGGCTISQTLSSSEGTRGRSDMGTETYVITPLTVSRTSFGLQYSYQRIPLTDLNLSSIRSAVFVESRSAVFLTDPIGGRVAEITLADADVVSMKSAPELGFRSAFVAESGDGYVQLVNDSRCGGSPQEMVQFDWNIDRKGVAPVVKPRLVEGSARVPFEDGPVAFYSWTVAGDRIFAYGLLDSGGLPSTSQPYKYGFFSYKTGSPGSKAVSPTADLVEEFKGSDRYTLGFPYIAAANRGVYYLQMGFHSSLKYYDTKAGGQPISLTGLPGESDPLPSISDFKETAELFGAIEDMSMPAGLYAQDGFLYLLHRSPAGGGTRWTLTRLRPEPDERTVRNLGTVRLPTEAAHLTVLLTEELVFVFEKSSVRPGSRNQDVESMVALPKSWITEPEDSPLRAEMWR